MDDDSPKILPSIYMVGMKIRCWRCGERMPVGAFLAPSVEGAEEDGLLYLAEIPVQGPVHIRASFHVGTGRLILKHAKRIP